MVDETDGIDEAIEGQLRILVTAAGQVGERIARQREESLRRAQAHSEQEARELASRRAAEQRAARAELAAVHLNGWWDRATPDQIGRSYQVARAWAEHDPEASRAERRVRDELRSRYGIDIEDGGSDPEAVRQRIRLELDRADRDRVSSEAERARAAAENAEAQRLLTQADQEDQRAQETRAAAEHEPDPEERARAQAEAEQREAAGDRTRHDGRALYDSAERRAGTAREMEARGIDREAVATRMRADVSQAKPATEAVAAGSVGRSPKARKIRGRAAQRQVQRPGLSR
ncbi:hypothetical protein ET495_17440 (plasmid) [Xylanimonas allomyrinae]|uniref:Colicin import membrane protein n=1 Tax=Xylanimonas allomyrinae TaxID=2509459 RepID=A0A4P6ESN4_9MICO|nr:hypothetical protein [Xylanimonas allomyrinae]QAY65003.1 hypothetical protein ET495_17440 [Xylanimonas allomyrinae]